MEEIRILAYPKSRNWGDALPPVLVELLTHKKPKVFDLREDYSPDDRKPAYLTVGSVLEYCDKNVIVWGSGFIDRESQIKGKPKAVCAVRGPLSREKLLELGVNCPEIYGDPALLLPRFYNPTVKKKYKLGIVPHYVDRKNELLQPFFAEDKVKIINMLDREIYEVVDDILSCEAIASSSLHGLIVADAYNIPSLWLEFSDKIIGKGFKFLDYYKSIGRKESKPFVVTKLINVVQILKNTKSGINIDLDLLQSACPFN